MQARSAWGFWLRGAECAVFRTLWLLDVLAGRLFCLLDSCLLHAQAWAAPNQPRCEEGPCAPWGPAVLDRSCRLTCGCHGWAWAEPESLPLQRGDTFHFLDPATVKWTDCRCKPCLANQSGPRLLHVSTAGAGFSSSAAEEGRVDVLFLHGKLSSSNFWKDTLLPHLSSSLLQRARLFLPDLLGLGKSPRPHACHYTLNDHLAALEDAVLAPYGLRSFHIVAHSMGTLVALALAGKYPAAVKSLTLLAPVYAEAAAGEPVCSALLRQWAPKKVFPFQALALSFICHYYHLGRAFCAALCANHRFWGPLLTAIKPPWVPASFILDFMQHSHDSAWHNFHNTIRGGAHVLEPALQRLQQAGVQVHVMHGHQDPICPYDSALALAKRFNNVHLRDLAGVDHVSIVLGRERQAALEVEEQIWHGERVAESRAE